MKRSLILDHEFNYLSECIHSETRMNSKNLKKPYKENSLEDRKSIAIKVRMRRLIPFVAGNNLIVVFELQILNISKPIKLKLS